MPAILALGEAEAGWDLFELEASLLYRASYTATHVSKNKIKTKKFYAKYLYHIHHPSVPPSSTLTSLTCPAFCSVCVLSTLGCGSSLLECDCPIRSHTLKTKRKPDFSSPSSHLMVIALLLRTELLDNSPNPPNAGLLSGLRLHRPCTCCCNHYEFIRVVFEKCCLLVVIYHLWFLKSFCPIF